MEGVVYGGPQTRVHVNVLVSTVCSIVELIKTSIDHKTDTELATD